MNDPRYDRLARIIVRHSTRLKKGEKILIEAIDIPSDMIIAVMRAAHQAGAVPFVTVKDSRVLRELYRQASSTSMSAIGRWEAQRMQEMHAYVSLRGMENAMEMSDVTAEQMKLYQQHWWKPVHLDIRVPRTRWVVLRWPNPSMAQLAKMSTEAFERFYFDVCTLDYGRMARAMKNLAALMRRTDRVRITGPGTELSFSIKNIPVIPCSGSHNLPDGEIFTAPVRDSVNGRVRFTAPTIYQSVVHENVELVFRNGKIIRAKSDKREILNAVLDTDEGSRYIGEFALGVNPHITRPMLDILFDEKISGSFHFTPGNSYDNASNGNRSQVHWDMVCIQTPEYGGGEIYFDDRLIRKDGLFVPRELQQLNPQNLLD
ncbi:aminopeptidase [bacterium]|nr:aminopeptidase [bacterium]